RAGLQGFAGRNSYGVYLIHPLILVPVSVLMTPVALSPLLKFVIVLPVTVVLCFIASDVLRRLPGMKSVL
ncbi:MAG: acyltransferase family protein, partial [Anaerolineaceae bacterium]